MFLRFKSLFDSVIELAAGLNFFQWPKTMLGFKTLFDCRECLACICSVMPRGLRGETKKRDVYCSRVVKKRQEKNEIELKL